MFPKPSLPAVRQEAEERRASEQAHSEAAEQPHVSFRMAEESRKQARQKAKEARASFQGHDRRMEQMRLAHHRSEQMCQQLQRGAHWWKSSPRSRPWPTR